jgi:hypothetical protein
MEVIIIRDLSDEKQILGKLKLIGDKQDVFFECDTLELADKGNQPQISCIPKGSYNVVKVGPTHAIPYDHFAIQNVPNRSGVCIHIGNYASGVHPDTLGCIFVGKGYGDLNKDGELDILNSKKTFAKLMGLVGDSIKLTIK